VPKFEILPQCLALIYYQELALGYVEFTGKAIVGQGNLSREDKLRGNEENGTKRTLYEVINI